MVYKEREEPFRISLMQSLKNRLPLSRKDNKKLSNAIKGFEGECFFDSLTEKLICDCEVLNDLLLEVNDSEFQIDSLVMTGEGITLYEVKNFEGNYIYEGGNIRLLTSKQDFLNPSEQTNRAVILFKQWLALHHFNFKVLAYVVFVNKNFSLFHAPEGKGILLPGMLDNHFEQVNKITVPIGKEHDRLAQKLCEQHISSSSNMKYPKYNYDNLKKRVYCSQCSGWIRSIDRRMNTCQKCGYTELNAKTILRHIRKFQILFPNRKLTTPIIYEWCGELFSKKSIQLALSKNYKSSGVKRARYYY